MASAVGLLSVRRSVGGDVHTICPHCSEEFHLFPRGGLATRLEEAGVKALAQLPLDPDLAQGSDEGMPDVLSRPQGPVATALAPVIETCIAYARERSLEITVHSLQANLDEHLNSAELEASLQGLPDEEREKVKHALQALLDSGQRRVPEFGRGQE